MSRPRALINGFGRIGRLAFRRSLGWHGADLANFEVVHVNELGAVESAAYLCQFDSTHGQFSETAVKEDGSGFTVTVPTPGGGVGETLMAEVGYSRAATPGEVRKRKREESGLNVDSLNLMAQPSLSHAPLASTPLHRSPSPPSAPSTWSWNAPANS